MNTAINNDIAGTPDSTTLNQWYVIVSCEDLRPNNQCNTRLLGHTILGTRTMDGAPHIEQLDASNQTIRVLPVIERFGYVFTTLGEPGPLFEMPEFDEPGRRLVTCGSVSVRTSPGRIVENFLDMSHFPFVHTGVLGAEPLTEVSPYKVHIDKKSGELWATECGFNQPKAMASSTGSADVDYQYQRTTTFHRCALQNLPN